jgi:chromosome segregation ATPase
VNREESGGGVDGCEICGLCRYAVAVANEKKWADELSDLEAQHTAAANAQRDAAAAVAAAVADAARAQQGRERAEAATAAEAAASAALRAQEPELRAAAAAAAAEAAAIRDELQQATRKHEMTEKRLAQLTIMFDTSKSDHDKTRKAMVQLSTKVSKVRACRRLLSSGS